MRYRLEGLPIETYAKLFQIDGENYNNIAQNGTPAGKTLELWAQVQEAGDYILEVEEWGNNGYSYLPYRSTLDFIPNDGFNDPDIQPDTLPNARRWKLNERLSNTILPIADKDVYKLDLPTPGMLLIEAMSPIEFYVHGREADNSIIFSKGTPANGKMVQYVPIDKPKSIYFTIEEWGNNNTSPAPYVVSNFWYPAENREQAGRNDSDKDASGILCSTQIQGNIFPIGDHDWYKFLVPFPGQLTIKGATPLEVYTRLRDSNLQILTQTGFQKGKCEP